jgi:HSP20 family protein
MNDNDKIIVISVGAILLLVVGIQTYVMFQLNEKVEQFSQQNESPFWQPIKKPPLPATPDPKFTLNDPFSKNQFWNPYEEMQRMQAQMEQIFGDSFSRFHGTHPFGSFDKTPETDLKDTADAYVVTINAPGADKSSLDVKLEGQQLSISIKTEVGKDSSEDNGKYQRRERFVGKLHRVLTLPGAANAAKMTTDYTNGVLTITIPKKYV